jgi:hypothetical protein
MLGPEPGDAGVGAGGFGEDDGVLERDQVGGVAAADRDCGVAWGRVAAGEQGEFASEDAGEVPGVSALVVPPLIWRARSVRTVAWMRP